MTTRSGSINSHARVVIQVPDIRGASLPSSGQSGSPFHGNGEPLYLFVLTQFRTENRFTLFLELLSK
jgi:hypothetical protein